jgi:hypothetical protein
MCYTRGFDCTMLMGVEDRDPVLEVPILMGPTRTLHCSVARHPPDPPVKVAS